MAETVIDRARPTDFRYDASCRKCESDVAAFAGDVEFGRWKVGGYYFAGTEQIEEHFTFECPACGHAFNPIPRNLIPEGIRIDAMDEYNDRKNSPGGSMIL